MKTPVRVKELTFIRVTMTLELTIDMTCQLSCHLSQLTILSILDNCFSSRALLAWLWLWLAAIGLVALVLIKLKGLSKHIIINQ